MLRRFKIIWAEGAPDGPFPIKLSCRLFWAIRIAVVKNGYFE